MNIDAIPPESKEQEEYGLQPEYWYAITINPDNSHQYVCTAQRERHSWKERLSNFTKYWQGYLETRFSLNDIDYYLHIEVAQKLSDKKNARTYCKINRLHFHGKIRFRTLDALNQFLLVELMLLRSHSTVEIKPIKDTGWEKYCTKQQYLGLGHIDNKPVYIETYPEWFAEIMELNTIIHKPVKVIRKKRVLKKKASN